MTTSSMKKEGTPCQGRCSISKTHGPTIQVVFKRITTFIAKNDSNLHEYDRIPFKRTIHL